MDVFSALKDFGLPALGALGGFIATSYALRNEVKQLKLKLSDLSKGWKLKFDEYKEDADKRHDGHEEELEKKYKELKEQLAKLESSLNSWQRESSHSFARDDEFNRFVEEMQRQWGTVQRTLGQIEGMMKKLP